MAKHFMCNGLNRQVEKTENPKRAKTVEFYG